MLVLDLLVVGGGGVSRFLVSIVFSMEVEKAWVEVVEQLSNVLDNVGGPQLLQLHGLCVDESEGIHSVTGFDDIAAVSLEHLAETVVTAVDVDAVVVGGGVNSESFIGEHEIHSSSLNPSTRFIESNLMRMLN